jgi:branched-chain amino acid transport system ATP-binding protein
MILEVKNIYTAYYGLSDVLFGVSLELDNREVVALIGRNGVGKTTTFRSIMGLTPPKSGQILWKGKNIVGKRPYEIARLGVGLTPGDREIFPDLTVWENLDVGRKNVKADGWDFDKVFALFPALEKIENRKGGYLSGGEQQMLAVARTLMGNPDLLLLDEPSEGLAPLVVRDLKNSILKLRDEGETILLAEQNFQFCIETCSRAYVLEKGQIVWQGQMADLKDNEEVKKQYLLL